MKFLVILALVAFVAARPEEDKPDYSRYENFNVDEVVGNDRFLSGYSKCFQGIGKCTPEASDFKKWIPDAVQSNCSQCSEHQKTLVARVIKAIMDKLPEDWVKLNKIYNPDGKYTEGFKLFVDKYAVKQ
ncbi:ejaculatory bulb-specific protein 3-like [Maniola hyperantus]|uniref:ejaculatory bulb-specific protein 3-like n=1 Tax=Aphantopus hyperantus TaxID=2795564 RepID=UPI001568AB8D|nr:ejaculatory bulb-specific protein 3-like [Maniola hyperantus]